MIPIKTRCTAFMGENPKIGLSCLWWTDSIEIFHRVENGDANMTWQFKAWCNSAQLSFKIIQWKTPYCNVVGYRHYAHFADDELICFIKPSQSFRKLNRKTFAQLLERVWRLWLLCSPVWWSAHIFGHHRHNLQLTASLMKRFYFVAVSLLDDRILWTMKPCNPTGPQIFHNLNLL